MLKDEEVVSKLGLAGGKLYFKDLGPQVGWSTVSTGFYPNLKYKLPLAVLVIFPVINVDSFE